jgi:hypothetical protein
MTRRWAEGRSAEIAAGGSLASRDRLNDTQMGRGAICRDCSRLDTAVSALVVRQISSADVQLLPAVNKLNKTIHK